MNSLIALAAVVALAGTPPHPRTDDIQLDMTFPGVQVTVEWQVCGQVNAYYYPGKRKIVMCEELREMDPGAVRFFFAHEMAHAIIMQLDLPIVVSHEAAADELAGLIMYLGGNAKDTLAAAVYFLEQAEAGHQVPIWDDHPDDAKRALTLYCLSLGPASLHEDACSRDWREVYSAWVRLIAFP
jgi:Zn-dependent protease with chaperone function